MIYAALITLDKIPHINRTDTATQPYMTTHKHIFTLPPLQSIMKEQERTEKSIMVITITAIVTFTTKGIFICIWKSGDIAHH